MHYYKIVDENLRSCCKNPNFPEEYKVQYKIGEFVEPTIKNTCLYVFDDLSSAINFLNDVYIINGYWEIYKCETVNAQIVTEIAYPEDVRKFWEKEAVEVLASAPKGTYSCDSVKLIEKVEDI